MNRDCEQPDDVRVVKTEQYCSSERCGSSPYRRERKPLVSIDLTAGAYTSAATNGHRFHSATLRPGVADFLLLADPFQLPFAKHSGSARRFQDVPRCGVSPSEKDQRG